MTNNGAMTDIEIIELLGGLTAIARMLKIKPPSVFSWRAAGIPENRLRELASQIEIKSNGRFTRKERWPDNYAFYWPELAETQQKREQAAPEFVAISTENLPPIVDPLTAPAWDGIDRRDPVSRPVPTELDRRNAETDV